MQSQKKVTFEAVTSLIYERKFDTALRKSTTQQFKQRLNDDKSSLDDQLIIKSNYVHDIEDSKCDGRLFSQILKDALVKSQQLKLYRNDKSKVMNRIPKIIRQTVNIQWDYINSQNHLPEKHYNRRLQDNWLSSYELPIEVQNLMLLGKEFEVLITKLNKINDRRFKKFDQTTRIEEQLKYNHHYISLLDMTIVWSNKLVWVNYKGKNYVFPRSYLLLIYNKIHDIVSILLFVYGGQDNSLPCDAYTILLEFIMELINLHMMYDESYYTLIKTLESLCIAETLTEIETWSNKQFLFSLNASLADSVSFDYLNSNLRLILAKVNVPFRHELCCLSKILGHPFVDMKEGTMSLFQKVQEPLTIDTFKVTECTNYIKENYIRNYIYKHNRWPPCKFAPVYTPKALIYANLMNKDPNAQDVVDKYGKTLIEHYNYVDLLPSMHFSKLENYIPYLKDKTVTLCRTRLVQSLWPKDEEQRRQSWRDTRLLLVYLLNHQIVLDHTKYIDQFANSVDLEDLLDYLVIRIVPKEKELKVDFRGFGCKTFEDRARALVQEKNVMEFLDYYSDEQAMTLGELPLCKKLYAFRNILKSYKGHKVLYINLDASSWNNRFRAATVDRVMEHTLDDIFGCPIFSKTHLAYEKTFFYIPDEGQTYWWEGQSGGIEGLNQDTWVVTYLGQIKSALKPLGYHYYVLCKGDDVRIAILIPPILLRDKQLSQIKNQVVDVLEKSLKQFGHTIKTADSYGSEIYFSFSKTASINTIELPQVCRKIQKSHGANNAFINTLDEYIASAFSNVHSSCKVSPNVTPIYCIAVFWASYYLLNHIIYRKCTDNEIITMMLTPSIIGGFPIIYLHNMFVRAESDLLSPFIGMMLFCKKYNYDIYDLMNNFLKFSGIPPKSRVSLYKDPYAIPLDRPTLPTTLLRMQIIPSLRKLTKNEAIKELFDLIDSPITEEILTCLDSANIVSARIFANVYAATPDGILDEILRKFETSRSVYELLILRGGERLAYTVTTRVYKAEFTLQQWRLRRLRGIDRRNNEQYLVKDPSCPARIAQQLRDKLWSCHIEGITMPPLQHQIHFTNPALSHNDIWSMDNHFTYHFKEDLEPATFKRCPLQYRTAGCKPFLGFTTRSGTIAPTVHFIEKDSILTKVRNLLDLISWTAKTDFDSVGNVVESNFHELLHHIIKLYSPEDLQKLGPFTGRQRSGTVQHHMRSPSFKESIVPNVLSNIYQQVVGVTNSHLKMRRSKEHYKVNFLHIYCYVVSAMFHNLEFTNNRYGCSEVWAVTSSCQHCMKAIRETPIVCNTKLLRTKNIRPLLITSVGSITEKLLVTSVKEFEASGIKIYEIPTDLTYDVACGGVIQEFIDQTYTSRIRLAERYNLLHMSEESRSIHVNLAPTGKTRDIGQSEIKNITPEVFIKYLVPKVHMELVLKYPTIKTSTVGIMLSSIPGEELPWYGLLEHIYRSGQLGRLIHLLHMLSHSKPPACFDNPARATHYVGIASYLIQETTPQISIFVLLSNYKEADIVRHLRPYVLSSLRRLLIKELNPQHHTVKRLLKDPNMKHIGLQFCAVFLCYCSINIRDETINDQILYQIKDVREGNIQLLNTDMIPYQLVEYGNLYEYITNECNHYMSWQLDLYSDLPWDEAYVYLQDNFDQCLVILSNYMKTVTLKIVYTDLPTCISYIRSTRPTDEVLDELLVDPLLLVTESEEGPIPHIKTTPLRAINFDYLPTPMTSTDFIPLVYDFTNDKVILQRCYFDRPYSSLTSSMNKICEVLSFLSLPSHLGSGLSFACLGEGYGGILNLFACMSLNSRFLFCTLPPNTEIETYPYAAMENIIKNHHHIYFSHHSIGYYDLSKIDTFFHFETKGDKYYIICCDAEVGDFQSPVRMRMVLYTLIFFLRNRTVNGILILKMNICEHLMIHYAIGILTNYVQTTSLFRCKASGLGGEVYLIAYGYQFNYAPEYKELIIVPNLTNYIKLEKFRADVYNRYHTLITQIHRTVEYKFTSDIHSRKWGYLGLDSNAYQKIQSILNLPLSKQFEMKLNTIPVIKNRFALLYKTYNQIPNLCIKLLYELTDYETRHGVWDRGTRRHKTIIAEKWLRQQGFLTMISFFQHIDDSPPILEQDIRSTYVELLTSLPDRLKWSVDGKISFRKTVNDEGFISHPYYNFIQGCHIAISLLGFYRCSIP